MNNQGFPHKLVSIIMDLCRGNADWDNIFQIDSGNKMYILP